MDLPFEDSSCTACQYVCGLEDGTYAENFVQYFGEAENMGYMERTKVVMEVVVDQVIVDSEEDCFGL